MDGSKVLIQDKNSFRIEIHSPSMMFRYDLLMNSLSRILLLLGVFLYWPQAIESANAAPPPVPLEDTRKPDRPERFIIRSHSGALDARIGSSAVLEIDVASARGETLTYQWYKDDKLLDEDGSFLVLLSLQPEESGEYHVIVSDSVGSTTLPAMKVKVEGQIQKLPCPTDFI